MGMGLSICHSIIENHNSRIWVSPGVNRGTIFQFELPAKPDKHGRLRATSTSEMVKDSGAGHVRRPSGLPCIADFLRRCGEPPLRAQAV
jgi:hypothetical protein